MVWCAPEMSFQSARLAAAAVSRIVQCEQQQCTRTLSLVVQTRRLARLQNDDDSCSQHDIISISRAGVQLVAIAAAAAASARETQSELVVAHL